jgi:hypothetical protein
MKCKCHPRRQAADWIDVGMETTPRGQVTHVWLPPDNVRCYVESLCAEIRELKALLQRPATNK